MTDSQKAAYNPSEPCLRCGRCAGCHAPTGDCPVPNTSCPTGTCPQGSVAAYPKHQANAYPHGQFASFTCPACAKRCVDAGQAEVGRPYIVEHADEWAVLDGVE